MGKKKLAIRRASVLQPFCCWFYGVGHAELEVEQGLRHCRLLWIVIGNLGEDESSLGMVHL